MERKALNIVTSALLTLSAFFFAASFSLAEEEGSAQYITQPVTINAVVGKVEVLLSGALDWQEASLGLELKEGDQIRTTEAAKAELVLPDGSFIRMKEKTVLIVETARQNLPSQDTAYNLNLRVGEIMLELQKIKPGSKFEVQTPTAVAAVRGTTYYIRTGTKTVDGVEKAFVEIFVDSGVVSLTNILSQEGCVVNQGAGAIVYDDGTVEGPFDIPPAAQEAWKSGFEMVYDDKRGMRDVEEEDGDTGEDVDDITDSQNDSLEGALQDEGNEQEIAGLARVENLTSGQGAENTAGGTTTGPQTGEEEEQPDLDGDGIADIEDAFAEDATIDLDTTFNDINEDPVTVKGYGSRDDLRQAAIDNLLAIQDLRQDIQDMISDIQVRQFEAVKEEIFDHQAAKVMTDRWGNRVRVEEYISKPTNDQVQILALNLRTAGPNAGISSLDFRVQFDQDISNTTLRDLPWDDYMSNPIVRDYIGEIPQGPDQDAQLIVYKNGDTYYNPTTQGYPLPESFSLEVKNPYAESVKAQETYSGLNQHPQGNPDIWYQIENSSTISINNVVREYDNDNWEEDWGQGWNRSNRFTFLERFADESWLMGVFYLVNDDGSLVALPASIQELATHDYLDEVRGIRDCINPDFNLEMVFLSSEFAGTDPDLPTTIAEYGRPTEAYERAIYNNNRTIDVITIPEITEPYRD